VIKDGSKDKENLMDQMEELREHQEEQQELDEMMNDFM